MNPLCEKKPFVNNFNQALTQSRFFCLRGGCTFKFECFFLLYFCLFPHYVFSSADTLDVQICNYLIS
jgi:hypothetical protein